MPHFSMFYRYFIAVQGSDYLNREKKKEVFSFLSTARLFTCASSPVWIKLPTETGWYIRNWTCFSHSATCNREKSVSLSYTAQMQGPNERQAQQARVKQD